MKLGSTAMNGLLGAVGVAAAISMATPAFASTGGGQPQPSGITQTYSYGSSPNHNCGNRHGQNYGSQDNKYGPSVNEQQFGKTGSGYGGQCSKFVRYVKPKPPVCGTYKQPVNDYPGNKGQCGQGGYCNGHPVGYGQGNQGYQVNGRNNCTCHGGYKPQTVTASYQLHKRCPRPVVYYPRPPVSYHVKCPPKGHENEYVYYKGWYYLVAFEHFSNGHRYCEFVSKDRHSHQCDQVKRGHRWNTTFIGG